MNSFLYVPLGLVIAFLSYGLIFGLFYVANFIKYDKERSDYNSASTDGTIMR